MHLKRIEINGFKSFISKTLIELNKGITVIVGPNGSGKSNVIDALRWVLGEQSVRSLRGNRLEDVIFSGTRTRKSLGMAMVSITLDNSAGTFPIDYHEITITRKAFRNGESRYLINKNLCRLKDIQELFMDTGLGKGASFAISGQGKVDEIISSNPIDRRPLFEEAAGITKYKLRKKEAELKFEDSEQNLLRLEDILAEITGQFLTLQEEAKKAQEYLDKNTRLKSLEYQSLSQEQKKLTDRYKCLEQDLGLINTKAAKYHCLIGELEKLVNQKKLHKDKHRDILANLTDTIGELKSKIERLHGHGQVLQEQINAIKKENALLTEEIKENQVAKDALQHNLITCREEAETLNERLVVLKEKTGQILNDALIARQDAASEEKEAKVINDSLVDLDSMLSQYRNDIIRWEEKEKLLKKQEDKLDTAINEKKAKLLGLEMQHKDKELLLAQYNKELQQLGKQRSNFEESAKLLKLKSLKVLENKKALDENARSISARLKFLQELETNKEGYFPGVRYVLNAKAMGKFDCTGIVGSVADVIDVPQQLILPIEVGLGSQLQNIITVSMQDAKKAIEYLKKERAGKATFLPMDAVNRDHCQLMDDVLKTPGLIGQAAQLVKYDLKYMGIINYLLGRILIAESLDTGLNIAKETVFTFKIVSLDGQLISPGGAITGGFLKGSKTSILSRRKEIADLNSRLKVTSTKLQKLALSIASYDEQIRQSSEKIERLNAKFNELDLDLTRKTEHKLSLFKRLEEDRLELKLLADEKQMLNDQVAEFVENGSEIEKRLKAINEEKHMLLDKLMTLNEKTAKKRNELEAFNKSLGELELEEKLLSQSSMQKEEQIADYLRRIEFIDQRIASSQINKNSNLDRLNRIDQMITDNHNCIMEHKTNKIQILGLIDELKKEINADSENLCVYERCLEKLKKQNDEVLRKQHLLELDRIRTETNLAAITQKINEAYSEDFVYTPLVVKNPKQETAKLKSEIDALGHVNTGSIEQFGKLKQRIDFLGAQKADLVKAKQTLSKIILEIDSIIEERFIQTFASINQHFSGIFRYLFMGGNAHLSITDEDDLLNTGVEIKAQPPGKKLQSLGLLSGGEKALTAIALLFAFIKVKPSPFCVLDEIEASLDESNEQRFSKFLKEVAQETQFLVVSHRQTTMLTADTLYGITMEEPGVSKVISMKINDGSLAI